MRWVLRTGMVAGDRTAVMGVLNVTPDSFSDGGLHFDPDRAVRAGIEMMNAGADVVDVGGESTRPGSHSVSERDELARVVPVIEGLVAAGVATSIDTTKPAVADAAFEAGAEALNDISALGDLEMVEVVGKWRPGVVVMHMQGTPATMQDAPAYQDVVGEVRDFLVEAAGRAEGAGVSPEQIAIDPGIGFGKTVDHNLALLASIDVLAAAGYPVLIGVSRKRFIGTLLSEPDPLRRDVGTAAAVTAAILRGASVVRVHNVPMIRQAARIADAIVAFE